MATRASGSRSRIRSSRASDIWSQTLSGCPSETDSDVKRKSGRDIGAPREYLGGSAMVHFARGFEAVNTSRPSEFPSLLIRPMGPARAAGQIFLGDLSARSGQIG